MHPGDLDRGCSDLEVTWLLYCAGVAAGFRSVFAFVLSDCQH